MFTGLIEAVGHVGEVNKHATGMHITVAAPFASDLQQGESVSVNGVCLTATRAGAGQLDADIGPETARITTLGSLRAGQPVNLERSMRADSRFGGHFVQGHVDGVGDLRSIRVDGDARWLTIAYPPSLAAYIVAKGSIAVDGISLTVAELRGFELDVMIIPFTWEHTNLASLHVGDPVNLECDMVGKYVARAVEISRGARQQPDPTIAR